MLRIVQINDPHFSDVPPASRSTSYCEDILTKFEWCLKYAVDKKASYVVCTGDWFHSKVAHRVSHHLVNRIIDVIRKAGVEVLTIAGNHDFPPGYGDMERQPYNTLTSTPHVHHCSKRLGDIIGFSYMDDVDEYVKWIDHESSKLRSVVILHHQIEPLGAPEQPFPYIPAEKLVPIFRKAGVKLCIYGHVHDNHGIYGVDGVMFCNPGSISRGSIAERDVKRAPCLADIQIEEDGEPSIELIEIPHKPPEDVFLFDKVERKRTLGVDIEQFMDAIQATSFKQINANTVSEHLRKVEPEGVRNACLEVWDGID